MHNTYKIILQLTSLKFEHITCLLFCFKEMIIYLDPINPKTM